MHSQSAEEGLSDNEEDGQAATVFSGLGLEPTVLVDDRSAAREEEDDGDEDDEDDEDDDEDDEDDEDDDDEGEMNADRKQVEEEDAVVFLAVEAEAADPDPEDDLFVDEFNKMMTESLQQRHGDQAGVRALDVAIPLNLKGTLPELAGLVVICRCCV